MKSASLFCCAWIFSVLGCVCDQSWGRARRLVAVMVFSIIYFFLIKLFSPKTKCVLSRHCTILKFIIKSLNSVVKKISKCVFKKKFTFVLNGKFISILVNAQNLIPVQVKNTTKLIKNKPKSTKKSKEKQTKKKRKLKFGSNFG